MIWQFHFWVYTQKNWKQGVRYLYAYVHNSIIFNKPKVEATQLSIDGWVDKQNVAYTCNGILFSIKKEGNSDRCYNMDESWRHYAKWNKPVTKGQILYESIYMWYLE